MANQQPATNNNKGNKSPATYQNSEDKSETIGQQMESGSNQLDQFVTYMKNNWKVILSELVAAGVSAYIAQSQKEKGSKMDPKQAN